jgi:hypothetical protein
MSVSGAAHSGVDKINHSERRDSVQLCILISMNRRFWLFTIFQNCRHRLPPLFAKIK